MFVAPASRSARGRRRTLIAMTERLDGRTARRDRNSEAVLDTVHEMFVEGNFSPAVEEVALRSGVSLRSVYRYFEDTEALLRLAIERRMTLVGDLYVLRNVGEGTLDAKLTSFRQVDWSSFRVNFFLLLDPVHADALPHTWLASFHLPRGHAAQAAQLSRDYPNLSLVDVDDLLDRIHQIVDRVSVAVRWVLAFSLLAGALVLAAALSASAAERRHEAALLRTLGARRAHRA